MVKLGELKLNQLSKANLNQKEMNSLFGGANQVGCCVCGCYYKDSPGGSSVGGNSGANGASGLESPGGGVGSGSKA